MNSDLVVIDPVSVELKNAIGALISPLALIFVSCRLNSRHDGLEYDLM